MEKIKLACFINFSNLQHLENSSYIYTLVLLSKKFGKISLINIDNLTYASNLRALGKPSKDQYKHYKR